MGKAKGTADELVQEETFFDGSFSSTFPCDCLLVAGGQEKKKLRAHKLILANFSSFFKGMFDACTDGEKEEGLEIIPLTADEPEALLTLVRAMYRGNCVLDEHNLFPVWDLADKYGCPNIVSMCEAYAFRSNVYFTGNFHQKSFAINPDASYQNGCQDSTLLNDFLKRVGPDSNREFLQALFILSSQCLRCTNHSFAYDSPPDSFTIMNELFEGVRESFKLAIVSLAFAVMHAKTAPQHTSGYGPDDEEPADEYNQVRRMDDLGLWP
eukprot:Colp12_sorted_trinity150504_noHs@31081